MIDHDKQLEKLEKKFSALEQDLQNPDIISDQQKYKTTSQEYEEVKEQIVDFKKLAETKKALEQAKKTLTEEKDEDMQILAQDEVVRLKKENTELETRVKISLIPKDPLDKKDVILEIRAGAGGDEAALFAANLYRLYSRYAENEKWQVTMMSANRIGIGGFKEVIFGIKGQNVYSDLKYESGVHRVQRVPETEKSGRVHTSTATVAVIPEADDVEIEVKEEDLRVDVYRASGHGGQSVNKTESAVRLTHVPTNLVVTCQDEKSQHKNKAKALKVLKSRLLAQKQEEEAKKIGDDRRSKIGTGDRSEKIRTYNYPQDRITDHRIKQNWHEIEKILDGNLGIILKDLKEEDYKQQLENN